MKRLFTLCLTLLSLTAFAQREVTQERMAEVYEEAKTPYKYGLVVVPEDNNHKIDCPTVFRQGDKWLMTYVVYNGKGAKDGRGYETWIAESDDLLHWQTQGRILSFRDNAWDCNQRGGFPALPDMEWGGSYTLNEYKGKHWMTYIGGEGLGYEAVSAPLFVGLAWTDLNIGMAHEWQSADKPALSIHDKDVQWWEKLTQYKSTIYWDKNKTLGSPFVMFYNAGGKHPDTGLKGERVGIALSKDMKKWKRYSGNPVFAHEADGTITGDAHIQKMGDLYVMFYFSAFNPSRKYKAYNTFACSYDLIHWYDWQGADLITPSKSYDELFAHKSYVVKHDGVVYHFYCAVNKYEQRGIAVATSKPMGRSNVHFPEPDAKGRRTQMELTHGWKSWLEDKPAEKQVVDIPHNWDDYHGCRQLTHGNLHGTAIYVKNFNIPQLQSGKRYFLRFEGVGTYATITLNGKDFGRHPVGRTTLTLDVTDAIRPEADNRLEVKAEHPEMIADMPWVCGGCSSEWGFSEGSQPLGIFRPVVLEVTDEVRIEPFGVHIWNDDHTSTVYIDTEVKNYGTTSATVELVNKFSNDEGRQVFRLAEQITLSPGETRIIRQTSPITDPILWDTENPYLYTLATMLKRDTRTTDELSTPFGVRTISWPVKRTDGDRRFLLNDKPVLLNGVCEYEHQFGQSHAFSNEQIDARIKQVRNAGFNAFRDAHQPHHLRYQTCWDKYGILHWTQFSAHVWYDTPEFRANFKHLLRQWVKERRNSPAVIIWGLQNESTLPRDFARECSDIIREMDPTANRMRIVTTCNGGEGTDWNVIQNWSGTYGGDAFGYGKELSRSSQLLNGEYGAWRTLGFHTEPAPFDPETPWSEDRMCRLLEMKIRQANEVKDSVCGQFLWTLSSHDNPGRRQPDEAYRIIDKVGPFNYKGLLSPWEESTDAYYMYRANYVSPEHDPMVYLVSHTWADRFATGRRRADIEAYSNCDSVILYNDAVDTLSLGRKRQNGIGTHFTWENRDIRYNVLRAVGYYGGKPVCEDVLVLHHLEQAPHFNVLYTDVKPILKGEEGYDYLYRINCGGDAYADTFGQQWAQDDTLYSRSWASDFEGLNPYLASQRTTNDPIRGTKDWALFQSFRFGRHRLEYRFPVPDGDYRVELYFTEPWHGTGGSVQTDCEGLRIFDVAVNGETVIDDLDLWVEAGHDVAFKRIVDVTIRGGELRIHFPEVKAGQAVISGIAIASKAGDSIVPIAGKSYSPADLWTSFSQDVMEKTPKEMLPEDKNARTNTTYEAEDALLNGKYVKKDLRKQPCITFSNNKNNSITWNIATGLAQVYALRFSYMNLTGKPITVRLQFIAANGQIHKDDEITFPDTPEKWRMMSTTTGTYINAGNYQVVLSSPSMEGLSLDKLDVQ